MIGSQKSARLADGIKGPRRQTGKAGWILLWLIGVPLPVLLVLYLVFGA